jgi:hypothetical protein
LTAKVTYVKGMQFVGDAESGHAIVVDADRYFGYSVISCNIQDDVPTIISPRLSLNFFE